MDEISQISSIAERKLDFLKRLRQDCENITEVHTTPGLDTDDAAVRTRSLPHTDAESRALTLKLIDNAIAHIKAEHERLPEILNDLKSSLHDVRPQNP